MKRFQLIGMTGICVLMMACSGWNSEQVEFTPDTRIMVMSDTHYEDAESPLTDRLRDRVQQINAGVYDVGMVIVTGDNVDDVYGGEYEQGKIDTSNNRLAGLMAIYEGLELPFYLAIGNHDLKIASGRNYDRPWSQDEIIEMTALWNEHTGFDPYYGFTHKGWRFVILNSMGGHHAGTHFEPEQIEFLETELELNQPTLLFFHHAITTDHVRSWSTRESDLAGPFNARDFYRLLWTYQDQVKGIFVGHGHLFMDDLLYDKIQVVETDGFEDGDDYAFNMLELDTPHETIRVTKGTDQP